MNKTPCEKLGYEVGDKFMVINSDAGLSGEFYILDEIDDAGVPFFRSEAAHPSCHAIFCLEDVAKIYPDGWIEWKGGEMPVERGTLVSIKYRDGYVTPGVSAGMFPTEKGFVCHGGCRFANFWNHSGGQLDIVAYRLHKPEQQLKGMAAADVEGKLFDVKIVDGEIISCTPSKRDQPTIDELMHAWQKAKANVDTSRNILKLAEQDESAARKALDDALRAAGWGDASKGEPLNITDWRDLKPGDIVWWSGDDHVPDGEYVFELFDNLDDIAPFAVSRGDGVLLWVDIHAEQWRFIRRPA